jgi:hypothetical protein
MADSKGIKGADLGPLKSTASKNKQSLRENGANSNTPRKRVSQACDRCRSRKDKCDGAKPVCSTCAAQDQVCSYDPSTKKRGLPEGYVRGLEKLWGLSIREATSIEDTVLGLLGGENNPPSEELSRKWNDQGCNETLLESWRKSRISKELERLLPLLENSEDKTIKRKRQEGIVGRTEATADAPKFSGPDTFGKQLTQSAVTLTNCVPKATSVELPARAWHLLDIYFSYTHCWFPIVEKHDLLRVSYQYASGAPNISGPGSGDHAALWAILAYSDHQQGVVARNSKHPDESGDTGAGPLYSHARSLIPNEEGVFEIGHVQALLVLTLLNMGLDRWARAWLLVGQAVRMAMELGLDKAPPKDGKKTRNKHVFLGCFAIDTLVSARLERRPHLQVEDIREIGKVEEDGLEEWDPWTDCLGIRRSSVSTGPRGPVSVLSTFNHLIKILSGLNEVIQDPSSDANLVLAELTSSWNAGKGKPAASLPAASLLPHHYHLNLSFIGVITSLRRRIQDNPSVKATALREVAELLQKYSRDFGLLLVPPTFDCFFKPIIGKGTSFDSGQHELVNSIIEIGKSWPVFESLQNVIKPAATNYRQVAQSPASVNSYTATQRPRKHSIAETSYSAYEELFGSPGIPRDVNPERVDSAFSQAHPSAFPRNTLPSPSYHRPNSGTVPLNSSSVAIQQPSPVSLYMAKTPGTSNPTWTGNTPGQDLYDSNPAQLQYQLEPIGSDVDGDSMFNEFATLDAMEW